MGGRMSTYPRFETEARGPRKWTIKKVGVWTGTH